ncbi:MAG: hypothetical protein ABFD86_06230 [Bryobacteraceae bacterium]
MPFCPAFLVRQNFPDRTLQDIPGTVRRELEQAGFSSRLKPGSRVAIGVGSRGISNLSLIVRAVVDFWKSAGMRPFIFPAMGSHGGATAEGQAGVLAHFGITESAMGCPVVSSLEVVRLAKTPEGIATSMDRSAFESDGVMLIGRVKWHTDFSGKIESGLYKMMAIGLGKLDGAQRYHAYGHKIGLERVIRSVGRQVLASGKILGGLAILEDAYHHTAQLTAVPVEVMEKKEEELLELVKSWMGRIPIPEFDILIMDEVGKNISGAGMDTKVVNRSMYGVYNAWENGPKTERIFVRDLSEMTYGNAVGFGLSDVVTDRLVSKIDWKVTLINSLTASTPNSIRTPIHFPSDRQCLETIWVTVGKFEQETVSYVWIRNTLELTPLVVSENLRADVERNPLLEIVGQARELEYDSAGNLKSWW